MRQMIVDGELGTLIHLEVFFSMPTVHGSLVVQVLKPAPRPQRPGFRAATCRKSQSHKPDFRARLLRQVFP